MTVEDPFGDSSEDATSQAADALARTDEGECPVCGETDCDRVIHVHLASP